MVQRTPHAHGMAARVQLARKQSQVRSKEPGAALMGLASELPLPAGIRAIIASHAAYTPTPSALAVRAHLAAHPWIEDVLAMYPERHTSSIILGAPYMGIGDCWKCNQCSYARLYRIRRRYEPDPNPEGTLVCGADFVWA